MNPDLRTRYLGLDLVSPVVAAASPLTSSVDAVAALEDHGAGAVVLPSIFEEQLEREALAVHDALTAGADSFAEATDGYLPELEDYATGPDPYLRRLEAARRRVSIPVIASLNGTSAGGWVRFARSLEEAGASALELNLYHVPTDAEASGAAVEERYLEVVRSVRATVRIPLAVKLTPFFSSLPNMARRLVEAGADGLVLFNRFLQPDLDLDALEVVASQKLSTPDELRLRLRWIAILRPQVQVSLAATGGVHRATDALKAMLCGADVVQMAAALLERGPAHVRTVLEGMRSWLYDREYASVSLLRGSMSHSTSADPEAYERAQYIRALLDPTPVWRRGR